MSRILVAGSIVYDHLFTFGGELKDSFDGMNLDDLSVSFTTNSHVLRFGGCGANIAYNLGLLGLSPYLFGVVGHDFEKFDEHLKSVGVDLDYLETVSDQLTSTAYLLSDKINNQLTLFSPAAAMDSRKCSKLPDDFTSDTVSCAIVSPDNPQRMFNLAKLCAERGVPVIFDPGQALPVLNKDGLLEVLEVVNGVIVNNYEADLLAAKVGMDLEDVARKLDFLVKTMGEGGCLIFEGGGLEKIHAIENLPVSDVTGAGDAFRAGFLHAYSQKLTVKQCSEYGCSLASFALDTSGGQSHKLNLADFEKRHHAKYA